MHGRDRNDRVGMAWALGALTVALAAGGPPLGCADDTGGSGQGDDGASSSQTTASTDASETTDAGHSESSDGASDESSSVGASTSTDGGGGFNCDSDAATATIGAAGGYVELCGARLDVLAGTLASDTEFSIERLDPPPEFVVPADHEIAGPTFRFTSSGAPLGDYVRLTLPHERPGRVVLPQAVIDGELVPLEPCRVDDEVSVVDQPALGTLVSIYETIDFPATVSGLGDGEVTADFAGDSYVFSLDDPPNHAVHLGSDDGLRTLELDAWLPTEPTHHLLVQLAWDPELGDAAVYAASLALFDGADVALWMAGVDRGAVVELSEVGEHVFEGTASIPLYDANGASEILDLVLSFRTERWRYPIELACAPGFR